MTHRYARQVVLPEIGDAGQKKLAAARVLVVGTGGLGCPILQYLAGAGIGHITVVDPDKVEETNLHRQPLYRMSDVGRPKVKAAAEGLGGFNPEIEIEGRRAALDPANAPDLVAGADIVVDAADNFAATYILSDACRDAGKPLVSASVIGLIGYSGGYCGGAPSYRTVFPDLPASVTDCVTAGVMGPAAGLLGSLQAQMVLSILLGLEPFVIGPGDLDRLAPARLWRFRLPRCSRTRTLFPLHQPRRRWRGGSGPRTAVVRRSSGSAPAQARRVEAAHLPEEAHGPGRIVLCCRTGLRAWRGARLLHETGHHDLALLALGD